jgi:chemotaxis protein MotB
MKKRGFVSLFIVLFITMALFLPAMSLYAGGSKALRQKLDECEEGKATLQSENADLKTQLDNRSTEVRNLEREKRQCESEKRDLEKRLAEYEELIAYWQSEIEAYGFESEDPTVISRTVTETLAEKNAKIVELERDRDELQQDVDALEQELEQIKMQLEIAKRKLDQAEQDAEQYRIQYTLCERKVRDLETENAGLKQDLQVYETITEETKVLMDIALDRIQYALRNEIRRGEVRVFKGTLGITIDVLSADMFETGSVELTPTGKAILGKIAGLLEELDGYLIGIIGNADRRPIITPALKKKYPTNWELSSHRGASVVRFFLNESSIDPRRMVAMGLGEYQPIDNRRTAEGYGNNRRIDIVLLPIDAIAAVVIGAEVK